MDKGSLIGVVTVTYNSGVVIRDFMESALKQSHAEFILYVVDNASTDVTLASLAGYPDSRVTIIRNDENVGVAEGNNIGIRAALKDGCSYVLLINNDTVFESDVFSKLEAGLKEHECDMVVPKILFFDEPQKIWSAGGYFKQLRGASGHFGYRRTDSGEFNVPKAISYSPTCCMLIRREVFAQVGLMDSSYFVYFDDTDFCLRAYRAGVRLFYIPTARLMHKVSSLTGQKSSLSLRYYTRNHVYYVLKNYSKWRAFFYFPVFYLEILAKFLVFFPSLKSFRIAQDAFWEGVSLFVSNVGRLKRVQ